jgi:hypothetical protein
MNSTTRTRKERLGLMLAIVATGLVLPPLLAGWDWFAAGSPQGDIGMLVYSGFPFLLLGVAALWTSRIGPLVTMVLLCLFLGPMYWHAHGQANGFAADDSAVAGDMIFGPILATIGVAVIITIDLVACAVSRSRAARVSQAP